MRVLRISDLSARHPRRQTGVFLSCKKAVEFESKA